MFAWKNHGRGLGRIDGWWNEFHRRVIEREISRVLVLNLSGKAAVLIALPRITMPLTKPSLLSRGTPPDHNVRLISRSRSHVKITGVTIRTCKRELTMPPKTGVANGFMTSAPVRADHMMGRRPATMVDTVITLGLNRKSAPSITASRKPATVSVPSAALFRATASSRYITITTPVCTAVPNRAMNPTHTATEKL